MGTLIGGGVILALVLGVLVAAYLKGRTSGAAEASITSSKEIADAAQRMAVAEAAGPHTGDDALSRLRDHSA